MHIETEAGRKRKEVASCLVYVCERGSRWRWWKRSKSRRSRSVSGNIGSGSGGARRLRRDN